MSAAYAAAELAAHDDGESMDVALRNGLAAPAEIVLAADAIGRKSGGAAARRLALEAAANPWSGGERQLHRVLRRAAITGWEANPRIFVRGRTFRPDVLFRNALVILEFDGMDFHSDPVSRDKDYERQNQLVLAGYMVLRFTWTMLTQDPTGVARVVRRALRGKQ